MPLMLVMPPQLTGLDPAPTHPTCVPTSIYPLRRGGSRNSLGVVGQGQDVNYCPVGEAAGVAKFPYPAQRPPLLVYSLISPSSRPHQLCMVAFMAGVVNNKADPASCHELMN